MKDRVVKEIASADGKWRARIVQRSEGNHTYRVLHDRRGSPDVGIHRREGPDLGIYDTAETAEAEALSKMRQRMC